MYRVLETTPILEAVVFLIDRGVTGLPVVDKEGRVLGMLSEEHCLTLVAKGDADGRPPAGTVASYYDATVPQVTPDMDIYYVAGLFLQRRERRFPVVECGKLVGEVTRKDLLRAVRDRLSGEVIAGVRR